MLYRLQSWRDPERLAALAFWIALLALLGVIEASSFRVPALAVRSWSIVREVCAAGLLLPLVLAGFRRVPPVSGATAIAHGAASIVFGLLVYAAAAGGIAGPLNFDRLNGVVALYWILLAARGCHLSLRGPEPQRAEQLSLDLVRAPSEASSHRERFVVQRRGREVVVPAGEINWIQAAGHDVVLHLGGASYRLRESMQSVEQSLDPSSFVRVHRSRIVNLDRVRDIRPWAWGDFRIVMQDGSVVNFSRRYRDRLEELLSS
jgi:hypothetical protein